MPFTSRFPTVSLPEKDIFSFIFHRRDRAFPENHVIFHDAETDQTYTFSDVQKQVIRFGKGLKSTYKWQKGDVLALFSPNHIDIPAITLGAHWAGGVVAPANPGYTTDELSYQLKDSGARMVVTQLATLGVVKEACSRAGIPEAKILLIGGPADESERIRHWSSVKPLSDTYRHERTRITPKVDTAFLVYSSGTTGKPKGVKLTHYNLTSNILQVQPTEYLSWDGSRTAKGIPAPKTGGDKILAPLPFFHIYGLNMFVLTPLYTGVTTVVMSRFELEKWCSLVEKHQITYSYIVPPIALQLAKHPSVTSYDLSSIRMTNSGAAPLTIELVEAVYKRTGIRIKQGYGLSETSPGLFHQRWEDWRRKAGSVGWLLPNLEAKVCVPSEEGLESHESEEVGVGETGELYVKGPNVFLGYHNNNAATSECLSTKGWFRTGDVGHLDHEGNLFITDRLKELIKFKGFQVAPAEIEGYLHDHPSISDCAVVGVWSAKMATEVPRAYVVLQPPEASQVTPISEDAIATWLNGRVANHKKLRGGVRFVDSIPKNPSGKILRRILKDVASKDDPDAAVPKL